jgi:hypothetical protein
LHELETARVLIDGAALAASERTSALEALGRVPALFREFCDAYNPRFQRRLVDLQRGIVGRLRADARAAQAVQAAFDALNMRMGVERRRPA